MIQDTEQLSFTGITCELRQKPVFTHPKDAEIKALYLSGESIDVVARKLCLGRKVVAYSCERQGITRPALETGHIDWAKASALYRAGNGTKAIAKAIGGSQAAIRSGLIKLGVYKPGQKLKQNAAGPWAGRCDELDEDRRYWNEYDAAIRKAYPRTVKQNNMERYYANHEASKAYSAAAARKRHARLKNTPEWKAKQFARNQLQRIKRQVMQNQKSRRTHEYLGCTFKQAAEHITSQLKDGWTWDNYGIVWEIDHIIQLSDVDLLDAEQMARVCHYTNLRPLAVTENRSRPRGLLAWQRKQQRVAA